MVFGFVGDRREDVHLMRRAEGILLKTERLNLRTISLANLDDMTRLNRDPAVMRYIGDGAVWTRAQSEARIRRMLRVYENFPGLGMWIGEEQSTGRFVGAYVLNYIPNTVEVEVGYRLCKSAWGRGFATEGARALVRYGLLKLGLYRVVGLTHPDNEPSKRVLMKAGLRPAGMGRYYDKSLCYFVAENA